MEKTFDSTIVISPWVASSISHENRFSWGFPRLVATSSKFFWALKFHHSKRERERKPHVIRKLCNCAQGLKRSYQQHFFEETRGCFDSKIKDEILPNPAFVSIPEHLSTHAGEETYLSNATFLCRFRVNTPLKIKNRISAELRLFANSKFVTKFWRIQSVESQQRCCMKYLNLWPI